MMKNRFLLLISLFLVQSVFAQQDAGFYFYSQEDMNNIKSSSKTEWGRKILKRLDKTIAEREKHSLEIPTLEGDMAITIFVRFIILSLCLIGTALKNTIALCVKRNGVEWINMTGLG